MNETLRRLLDLQELDREIFRLRKELSARPAALAREEAGLHEAEQELEKLKGRVRELQKLVDAKNLDLKMAEDGIRKLEAQAQTLKTNEEYQAMQKQIAARRAEIGGIEDRILESMEVVDQARGQMPAREAAVKERHRAVQASGEKAAGDLVAMTARLREKEEAWERLAPGVTGEALARYRHLRDRHGPTVVAELTPDGVCQGCFMSVTTARLNQVMAGGVVHCTSCERFLWLP